MGSVLKIVVRSKGWDIWGTVTTDWRREIDFRRSNTRPLEFWDGEVRLWRATHYHEGASRVKGWIFIVQKSKYKETWPVQGGFEDHRPPLNEIRTRVIKTYCRLSRQRCVTWWFDIDKALLWGLRRRKGCLYKASGGITGPRMDENIISAQCICTYPSRK
jgi:hypothetical protein